MGICNFILIYSGIDVLCKLCMFSLMNDRAELWEQEIPVKRILVRG